MYGYGQWGVFMKWIMTALAMVILSGCGDTINQPVPVTTNSKLVIRSATMKVYSSHYLSFNRYSSNGLILSNNTTYASCRVFGTIEYDGNPQGATLAISGNPKLFSIIMGLTLLPNKQMSYTYDLGSSCGISFPYPQTYIVLTDPYGNDSNILQPTMQNNL